MSADLETAIAEQAETILRDAAAVERTLRTAETEAALDTLDAGPAPAEERRTEP